MFIEYMLIGAKQLSSQFACSILFNPHNSLIFQIKKLRHRANMTIA